MRVCFFGGGGGGGGEWVCWIGRPGPTTARTRELTHGDRHILEVLSLNSALLDLCHAPDGSRGSRPLLLGRTNLGGGTSRLVEDVACNTALGHDQILPPGAGGAHSHPGNSVSKGRRRVPLDASSRVRISTDERGTAKAHKELVASSHKSIDKLKTKAGGIDVGMPVGGVCKDTERR